MPGWRLDCFAMLSQATDLPWVPCQRCSSRPAWHTAELGCIHKKWEAHCQLLHPHLSTAGAPLMQTMLGSWDKHLGAGPHLSSRLAQSVAINSIANSYMVSTDSESAAERLLARSCSAYAAAGHRAWFEGNTGKSSLVSASIACHNVRSLHFVLLTATSASVA